MSLACISISHKNCPVNIREILHLNIAQREEAYRRFVNRDLSLQIADGMVILSTCNRTELYFHLTDSLPTPELLVAGLAQIVFGSGWVLRSGFESYIRHMAGANVVRHLCRVASGLESVIVGEPQILGQVSEAVKEAAAGGACGPVLARLFQTAVKSGRRARNETDINRRSLNAATVAVNLAERELATLAGKTALLLGAGEMASLAMLSLHKRGVDTILVLNRTLSRAEQLAARWNATALRPEQLDASLVEADVVIASTGSPQVVLDRQRMECAMRCRPTRPIVIIDLAVPRDVASDVGDIDGVWLWDIDELWEVTEEAFSLRKREIPHVERIIEEEIRQFARWHRNAEIEPIFATFHRKAEQIRAAEMRGLQDQVTGLSVDETLQVVEQFSRSLVGKLFNNVIKQLRK